MSDTIPPLTENDGESKDLKEQNIEKLKQLFPEIVTDGKVDFETLEEVLGEFKEDNQERYSFTWNGKSKARKLAMTTSSGTLRPAPDESVNWDTTENLFIEGDNLEVLKLLQRSYHGKVKMIYIDPPYNTGNDFVYNDDFKDNLSNYLKLTGQKDGEGNKITSNPETSGRYHTDWLNMIYPRLKLSRELLSQDGMILVSIDDNELPGLRMVMNEIFGEECFRNCIIFKRGIKSVQAQFDTIDSLAVGHEYIVMYSKDSDHRFNHLYIERDEFKPGGWNNHWRGTDRPTMRYEIFGISPSEGQWRWGKERSLDAIENYKKLLNETGNEADSITQEEIDSWWNSKLDEEGIEYDLLRLSNNNKPEHYVPPSNTKLGSDLWTDLSPRGSSELKKLFGKKIFDNPKPTKLIERMLSFLTNPDSGDIVLDFFAGSGSTAHGVMKANLKDNGNRKYILVQLPESLKKPKEINGTTLKSIADLCKVRLKEAGNQLKSNDEANIDIGYKAFRLDSTNIKEWDPDWNDVQLSIEESVENVKPNRSEKDLVFEIVLKYGLELSIPMERKTFGDYEIYVIGLGALFICLSNNITTEVANWIGELKNEFNPELTRVVFSDSGFKNDVSKTNVVQILKQFGISDVKSV